MAQNNLTYSDKTNPVPIVNRTQQATADDFNEIKQVVNDNAADAENRLTGKELPFSFFQYDGLNTDRATTPAGVFRLNNAVTPSSATEMYMNVVEFDSGQNIEEWFSNIISGAVLRSSARNVSSRNFSAVINGDLTISNGVVTIPIDIKNINLSTDDVVGFMWLNKGNPTVDLSNVPLSFSQYDGLSAASTPGAGIWRLNNVITPVDSTALYINVSEYASGQDITALLSTLKKDSVVRLSNRNNNLQFLNATLSADATIAAGVATLPITINNFATISNGAICGFTFLTSGSTSYITQNVNQIAHGLSVLNSIYHNGTNWVKALADPNDLETTGTHIVVAVADVDNFTYAQIGTYTINTHGLTVGEVYFTSSTVAGELTVTEPSVSNPMLYVPDANSIIVLNYRPSYIEPGGTTRRRISPTISTGVLNLDFDSLNDIVGQALIVASADFSITFSNTANADLVDLLFDLTGTINITITGAKVDSGALPAGATWNSTTDVLTIAAGTNEVREMTIRKVGSVYYVTISGIWA